MSTTITIPISAGEDESYSFHDGISNWFTDGLGVGKWQEYAYSSSLRFNNVTVPADAQIVSATIALTSSWSEQGIALKSKIFAEITGNPTAIVDYNDFQHRVDSLRTTADIEWDISVPWPKDASFTSPNFATVVQEVVSSGEWVSGNSLSLFWVDNGSQIDINGYGSNRGAYCYEVDQSKVAVLTITYNVVVPGVIDVSVIEGGDDGCVILDYPAGTRKSLDSVNTKFGVNKSVSESYNPYYRFQNVVIDQKAIVKSATLTVTCENAGATGGEIYLDVRSEDSGNASQITTINDWGDRVRGESWFYIRLSDAWVVDSEVTFKAQSSAASVDIRALVQEVVDRTDWVSGNAMQFFIRYWAFDQTTWRQAYSYEDNPVKVAKLHIEYDPPLDTGNIAVRASHPYGDVSYEYNFGSSAWMVSYYDTPLAFGKVGTGSNYSKSLYLKFLNVFVPTSSTSPTQILSAKLVFKSSGLNPSTGLKMKIQGCNNDRADDVVIDWQWSTVSKTVAFADWNIDQTWAADTEYESPDLTSIIQEIVSRPGWVDGSSIGIFLNDNGSLDNSWKYVYAYDTDARYAPQLQITYAPVATSVLKRVIINGKDDGYCVEKTTNSTYTDTAATIEVGNPDSTVIGEHIALRFNDIQIPIQSKVNAAYIVLYFSEDVYPYASSWNTQWAADKIPNPNQISNAIDFLDRKTNRLTTSKVSCTQTGPYNASYFPPVVSPNLKSIVQELIDQTNWGSGNSMLFFLLNQATSTGEQRKFWAYEGFTSHYYVAELYIYYDEAAPPTFRVISGADDCMMWTHSTNPTQNGFDVSGNSVTFGTHGSLTYNASFRFQNITIPQGSIINSAVLQLVSEPGQVSEGINVQVDLRADSVLDAANIVGFDDFQTRLTRLTTASVDWTIASSWQDNHEYASADITTVITELIGNVGWTTGYPINIFVSTKVANADGNVRSVYSYEKDSTKQVRLVIVYTPLDLPWKEWLANEMMPQKDREASTLNQSVNSVQAQQTKWLHWKGIYEGIQGEAKTKLEAALANKITQFQIQYPVTQYDSYAVVYGGTYSASNISDWEIHGYLASSGADDILYVYQSTGWDNNATISNSITDWATMYPLLHDITWGAARMVTNLNTAKGIVTPWRDSTTARNPILGGYTS